MTILRTAAAVSIAVAGVRPAFADTHVQVRSTSAPEDMEPEIDRTPSLVLGEIDPYTRASKLDGATLAIDTRGSAVVAKLTVVVSGPDVTWDWSGEAVLPIEVPRGARVTGLAVTIGGVRSVGGAMSAMNARGDYRETIGWRRDPALLEHVDSSNKHDRLSLRVFPVSKTSPGTVEIEMTLPAIATLEIDPGAYAVPAFELLVDGKQRAKGALGTRTTIDLPPPNAPETEPAASDSFDLPRVSMFTSLYAPGPPQAGRGPIGVGTWHSTGPNKQIIRDHIGWASVRFRRCYMREAQKTPTLAGAIEMHFTITTAGKLEDISVDGELPSEAVKACVARELATIAFSPHSDGRVQVNYPITFAAK